MQELSGQLSFPMKKRRIDRPKKLEFIGWGSKPLIEFLESIGKDTSKQIGRYPVATIIIAYINANNLANPMKSKDVMCDQKLQAIFGKRSVLRTSIYGLLEAHYAANQDSSEGEGMMMISTVEEKASNSKIEHSCQNDEVFETPRTSFATVISENIKLVYLRRTLLEDLAKAPEFFGGKVMGSFVRIKYDSNGVLQKNSFQLHQVIGVKMTSEVHLQLSNNMNDVPLWMLSDKDFSEEECEDLCRRIKEGLLKRPTIVELEETAKVLHEDITKHEIQRDLERIQNRIDHCNEKGLRLELYDYLNKRKDLEQSSELERRLCMIPKVIADKSDPQATPADNSEKEEGHSSSPKLIDWVASSMDCADVIGICLVVKNENSPFKFPRLSESKSEVHGRDLTKALAKAASPHAKRTRASSSK